MTLEEGRGTRVFAVRNIVYYSGTYNVYIQCTLLCVIYETVMNHSEEICTTGVWIVKSFRYKIHNVRIKMMNLLQDGFACKHLFNPLGPAPLSRFKKKNIFFKFVTLLLV